MAKTVNKSKTHLVAFVDILGFQEHIDLFFSGKDKTKLDMLEDALKKAHRQGILSTKKYLSHFNIEFTHKQFSDCVCFSMEIDLDNLNTKQAIYGVFFNLIRLYQHSLFSHEILCRGGISMGGHIEKSHMIFSEGLVKAYKLESKKSMYPRILIDQEIIADLHSLLSVIQPEDITNFHRDIGQNIILDWDDQVFLSSFGIYKQLKYIKENYGVDGLIQVMEMNSLRPISTKRQNELKKKVPITDFDVAEREYCKYVLGWVQNYIHTNADSQHDVKVKYKWLREFVLWELESNQSRINFRHYFQTQKK